MKKYFNYEQYKFLVFALILFPLLCTHLFIWSCGKKAPEKTGEVILAKIGEKDISVGEFIRRAEYTIRPDYCKFDNYIHKKIILNSLIAEKLLALEAGDENELTQNQQFQEYIQGHQEQAMRQWLYNEVAYKKAKLDTNDIKPIYQIAGRTYQVNFFSLKDSSKINQLKRELTGTKNTFEEVYRHYFGLGEIPRREVRWEDRNETNIHDALFSTPLAKGQIIGPLKADDGHYLLMEVAGWTDRMAISDTDIQKRWNDVSEFLKTRQANEIYTDYIEKIMKGKKVEFARDTFFKLAEIFAPFYLKSVDNKQEAFNQKFWKDEFVSDSLGGHIDEILDHSLLKIDGQTWKVSDFLIEMRIHPLVFRKRNMSRQEFPEQFKLAIVDMIRDKYITREAYKNNYHEAPAVKRNANMWKDNLLGLYQKNRYLDELGVVDKNDQAVIHQYLNSYMDSLQAKYSAQIEIDTDRFEKIPLTRVDMFVLQKNVPFPIIVPSFPLLTTDHLLDYGRKMETNSVN